MLCFDESSWENGADVTEKVRQIVDEGGALKATNELFGETAKKKFKVLIVECHDPLSVLSQANDKLSWPEVDSPGTLSELTGHLIEEMASWSAPLLRRPSFTALSGFVSACCFNVIHSQRPGRGPALCV